VGKIDYVAGRGNMREIWFMLPHNKQWVGAGIRKYSLLYDFWLIYYCRFGIITRWQCPDNFCDKYKLEGKPKKYRPLLSASELAPPNYLHEIK